MESGTCRLRGGEGWDSNPRYRFQKSYCEQSRDLPCNPGNLPLGPQDRTFALKSSAWRPQFLG